MRKKLTLTIDAEVYDMIKDLPRRVSVSEVISWFLKSMIAEIRKKGGFTEEEFERWVESTPEGRDFRKRAQEQFGPTVNKVYASIDKVKKKVVSRKGDK